MVEETKIININEKTKKKVSDYPKYEIEILIPNLFEKYTGIKINEITTNYFYTVEDIAKELNLTENTVRNILISRSKKFDDILKIYHIDTNKNRQSPEKWQKLKTDNKKDTLEKLCLILNNNNLGITKEFLDNYDVYNAKDIEGINKCYDCNRIITNIIYYSNKDKKMFCNECVIDESKNNNNTPFNSDDLLKFMNNKKGSSKILKVELKPDIKPVIKQENNDKCVICKDFIDNLDIFNNNFCEKCYFSSYNYYINNDYNDIIKNRDKWASFMKYLQTIIKVASKKRAYHLKYYFSPEDLEKLINKSNGDIFLKEKLKNVNDVLFRVKCDMIKQIKEKEQQEQEDKDDNDIEEIDEKIHNGGAKEEDLIKKEEILRKEQNEKMKIWKKQMRNLIL